MRIFEQHFWYKEVPALKETFSTPFTVCFMFSNTPYVLSSASAYFFYKRMNSFCESFLGFSATSSSFVWNNLIVSHSSASLTATTKLWNFYCEKVLKTFSFHFFSLFFNSYPIHYQKAFAWFSDLLVEHAEMFWSMFACDMERVLAEQPPDTWDSFPLFQVLNDYLRMDG